MNGYLLETEQQEEFEKVVAFVAYYFPAGDPRGWFQSSSSIVVSQVLLPFVKISIASDNDCWSILIFTTPHCM